MVKNKDRWSALSMTERADLIKLYVDSGITSLDIIKKDYNSFAPGGPIETDEYGYPADITPAVVEADYPRENEVWKRADASTADIIQRLKQGSSRATIPDHENPRMVATHKMMSAGNYVVGNVQNINGQLFDFTDPKHGFKNSDRAAIDSAIKRGDYVEFDTEGDARYFAEHYKKHYNSFGNGGDTQVELPDNIVKRLAYLIGSDYSVSSKGYASWDDIKRILSGKGGYPEFDDDKATFIFGNILGLPPAEGSNGKDYSKYLKDKYPLKYLLGKINEYQGIINPYDSYVIDERDRGLVEELAKKGKGVYLNADSEYSYMADIYDPPPYRNDVAGYYAQFVNTPNGYAISASDLYDFGPDYAGEKYNSEISTKDKILTGIESAALGFVGNPYILRQDNIPIEFINANDATWVEDKKDRIKGFSYALEHGMLSSEDRAKGVTLDEKLAKILETGYIEPAIITDEAKKANGGRILDGTEDEQTLSNIPTREMTPSEAAALNKTLNNSQYMLAVGDSLDDPAYLSTDYLEPAVVKAFSSTEDYNRYQGEKFGEYVSNEMSKAGTKLAPLLVGTAAAPWAISGGIAAYTNPITKGIIDLAGSIDGIRNAASENGVRKTIGLAKQGDVTGAIKSGVGDVFDIAGGIGLAGDLYKYSKGASKRLAEAVLRIGDQAHIPRVVKKQILNKDALNYILNPYANPNLAYNLPYRYSGNSVGSNASKGDIIDQYLRKVPVKSTLSIDDVPKFMKDYINKNYPNKDIAYIDLGELARGSSGADFTETFTPAIMDLAEGQSFKTGAKSTGLYVEDGLFFTKDVLDPGGYNAIYTRSGNDLIQTGFDIWKFNADDYFKSHSTIKMNKSKLKNALIKQGLRFIDSQGTPLVHKFTATIPNFYK